MIRVRNGRPGNQIMMERTENRRWPDELGLGPAQQIEPRRVGQNSSAQVGQNSWTQPSNSATDCPSTPAAPWLAFTFWKASQTSRFGMSNGFALSTELLPLSVGSGSRRNTAAPLVQFHYRTFLPPTSCSAPVPRIGTLILAV